MIGTGQLATAAASDAADRSKTFPDEFLWGCATARHQVGHSSGASLPKRNCFCRWRWCQRLYRVDGVYNRPVISPA
jgi:hypothetical protein